MNPNDNEISVLCQTKQYWVIYYTIYREKNFSIGQMKVIEKKTKRQKPVEDMEQNWARKWIMLKSRGNEKGNEKYPDEEVFFWIEQWHSIKDSRKRNAYWKKKKKKNRKEKEIPGARKPTRRRRIRHIQQWKNNSQWQTLLRSGL